MIGPWVKDVAVHYVIVKPPPKYQPQDQALHVAEVKTRRPKEETT